VQTASLICFLVQKEF